MKQVKERPDTMKGCLTAALMLVLAGALAGCATSGDVERRVRFESQFVLKPTLMAVSLNRQALELDVDEAIAEMLARMRSEDLLREYVLRPSRRPDLDYAVVTGIQGLRIERALGLR